MKIKSYSARYRYAQVLLRQLVKTDFKLRYQGSFLGYIWSLLKPLFLFAIMYSVFVKVLKVDYGVPHSGVYLLLGIVLWSFFAEITSGSIGSIVGKGDLLRKLNFPRYVIVLSGAFSGVINLALNMSVVAIFMIFSGVSLRVEMVLAPIVLAELLVFAVSLGFFLSAAFVRLRDVGYIWEVVMQALFYATPIFFPISFAPEWAQKIIILNPLSQTIQDLRHLLVSQESMTINNVYGSGVYRIIPLSITICLFVLATTFFKKRSKYFAEEI